MDHGIRGLREVSAGFPPGGWLAAGLRPGLVGSPALWNGDGLRQAYRQ